ncbi:bifunctional DNA-formamidopyrimidine glycosylase/DNA-(apurinic or apyrimidinic site) lyase [Vallicoccus soli]|uniref:Formamidopyrimidine-DNA glycosylase n=1 Tax=Vallicoccus soli TaxID=2339232 RepID=A0A3A3ZAX9_9ACTN|nr:bifunctional DNA-formamidopyrimidine glycosylase/DNA-(apurinic or apyrimidinic site) lyase [Vallicoccus soli]RJK98246.1 bifunctional DNA-formamidopyrimidine glycosylase/DNA-(apurinic or apyrimidinic site) lyase [Vallicoccus soli]
MPELPEVETVRRGLERYVVGRRVRDVQVLHPRAVRRHPAGEEDFAALLEGRVLEAALRRGKYLWLPLDSGDALVGHLGMSGQLLVQPPQAPDEAHLRVRLRFADDGRELRFVDQRTFGGLAVSAGGAALPGSLAHIARDPVDPEFDDEAFVEGVRRRRTGLKRALLDQTLVSGVGNIYADEALWRARLHWALPTATASRPAVRRLLAAVREVLGDAIAAGGTSFDALYVNVNGESGWFDRSLDAYGRGGEPCRRCGTPVRRDRWMNRSAYWCPTCQPWPRDAHP